MSPDSTVNSGELVLVDQQDRAEIINGKIYVVRRQDWDIVIKRVTVNRRDKKIFLMFNSDNPSYKPFEFEIPAGESIMNYVLGRIRWAGKEFD